MKKILVPLILSLAAAALMVTSGLAAVGDISTVAGTGSAGFDGDGVAATTAKLSYPGGVDFDGSGNMYIADSGNQRIRMVDAGTGLISTVAGDGS